MSWRRKWESPINKNGVTPVKTDSASDDDRSPFPIRTRCGAIEIAQSFRSTFYHFEARAIDDFFLCISPSVLIFGDLLWFSIAIGDSNVLLFSLFDASDASTKLLFLQDKVINIKLIKKIHTIAHRIGWKKTKKNRFQLLMILVLVAAAAIHFHDGIKIEQIYDACHSWYENSFSFLFFVTIGAMCVKCWRWYLLCAYTVCSEANRMQNEKRFDRNTTVIYCFHSFVI